MCWVLDEKHVDVIWHHDRRDKRKTVPIEMAQRTIYNACALVLPQHARPMASIEPALDRTGEALMIFLLSLSIPRLRMKSQPHLAFLFPSRPQTRGNGIR